MKYPYGTAGRRKKRSGKHRPVASYLSTGLIVAGLAVVFFYAVMWFRSPERQPEQGGSIADVMTADPESALLARKGLDLESEEATLRFLAGGEAGEAERDQDDDEYTLEVEASLPEIDRDAWYYEVWLLRQVPYGFFSAGEMVTNDLGEFVLDWEGDEGQYYGDYTNVVITLEPYDDNPDPSEWVAKGEFGE